MKKNNKAELAGKTVLLVHTGSIKKRFVFQKLKKLGLKVIVLNREKNWAQPYVDDWILADISNYKEAVQQVRQFLAEHSEIKIDGVLTFWEESVILTSKLVDTLNLTGIPFNVTKRVRNKSLFRDFCQTTGIPAPKKQIIRNEKDIRTISRKLQFPLVIKPVFGSSSAFVIKVEDKKELLEVYEYVRKNILTHEDANEWDNLEMLAEEYIDGKEVDIDIIIQNGRMKFYSISDNNKTREPFFVETGQSIPSGLPVKDQEDLIRLADETLEKLGVQNVCIHFEAKMTKTGPVPIEVNLRMGGDEVYSFVKGAWGVDLVENAVKVALGEYIARIDKKDSPGKYLAGKYFLADYSGILSQLNIDPKLHNKKYLEEIHFYKKIGDPVLVPPEGYEYLGWLTVLGNNLMDAQENLNEAWEMVDYEIAKFGSPSSIGRTLRKNAYSASSLKSKALIGYSRIERLRRMSIKNQRNLHVGVAGNFYDGKAGVVEADLMEVTQNVCDTLKERGYQISVFDFNNFSKVFNDLKASHVDLIFNVCERVNGSSLLEPHASSIFDILQIPYTGSNPFTLALCIDKIRVKKLLAYNKIPTPRWDYMYTMDDYLRSDLRYPLIVKPSNTDNSIGITNDSVVTNKKELLKQLEKVVAGIGSPALIEEYVEGDEYDVSILGSEEDDLRVLPLSRAIFKNMPEGYWHIYTQEAKFLDNPVYKSIIVQKPPRGISKRLTSLISEIALDTYNMLDCHDYGRVEIRVDKNNNPYILELNPNPSINKEDCVPAVGELVGMDYGDFLEEIIRLAIKRYKDRPPYYHLQSNLI